MSAYNGRAQLLTLDDEPIVAADVRLRSVVPISGPARWHGSLEVVTDKQAGVLFDHDEIKIVVGGREGRAIVTRKRLLTGQADVRGSGRPPFD